MWHTRKFTFSLQPYYSRGENVKFYSTSHNCFSIVQDWYFGKTKLCVTISNFALTLRCLDWRILSIFNFYHFFPKIEKKWVRFSWISPFKKSIDRAELFIQSSMKDFLPGNAFKSKFNRINYFQNLRTSP